MAEPLKNKETIKIKYTIGNSHDYEDGYDQGFKDGKREVWIILVIYAVLTLLSIFFVSKCNAQDKTDTTPVTILVRIQGRPWAFFHDGWEVRKVTIHDGMVKADLMYPTRIYVKEFAGQPIYSHLLYLDSRKRPIRKEWVVYQTYSR